MSFGDAYAARFANIIEPAIKDIRIGSEPLKAFRVDNSKTGDSILTDIIDGIAHSRLILADVSTVGRDAVSGVPYRNANVLYEVGIALSCRQPEDVLLVRDDRDRFLFDVSTVPHITIDFTQTSAARAILREALMDRLRSQKFTNDARVLAAAGALTDNEVKLLLQMLGDAPGQARGWNIGGSVLSVYEHAISRLLDKGIVQITGRFPEGFPAYLLTPLGRVVGERVKSGTPTLTTNIPAAEPPQAETPPPDV